MKRKEGGTRRRLHHHIQIIILEVACVKASCYNDTVNMVLQCIWYINLQGKQHMEMI